MIGCIPTHKPVSLAKSVSTGLCLAIIFILSVTGQFPPDELTVTLYTSVTVATILGATDPVLHI